MKVSSCLRDRTAARCVAEIGSTESFRRFSAYTRAPHREDNLLGRPSFNFLKLMRVVRKKFLCEPKIEPESLDTRSSTLSTKPSLQRKRFISQGNNEPQAKLACGCRKRNHRFHHATADHLGALRLVRVLFESSHPLGRQVVCYNLHSCCTLQPHRIILYPQSRHLKTAEQWMVVGTSD